ncbi:hypothetical protein TRIUR3_25598 [Triticum urartu]|uniref:Uncharacterized protein n=1 Tax=Triticum urartu TaxID=4572 RepID=M7YEY5_TRIUA|nr:hypothetical protein TRIUR3_25598 [Triticum urartu]
MYDLDKGTVNVSAMYNTRHHTVDSSVVARGDFWRLESSRGGSNNGNDNAPGFLIQLGPLLFVRDSTTLLLPINLSKQHLIWYAYDHKAFMDVEFSNGQFRYVAGEGITASGFLPLFGGLLQAHGKIPGETKLSFSFKIGRSKLNGEVGSSGVVVTMEKPLDNMGPPSLSVQLNGGLEF